MSRLIEIKNRETALAVIGVLRALETRFRDEALYEGDRYSDAVNDRDERAEELHAAACEAWSEAALICEIEARHIEIGVRAIESPPSETVQ